MSLSLKTATVVVASGGFTWSALALGLDSTGHGSAPEEVVDAVIVAGCRVDPGGVASPCLAARTDQGIALYQAGVAPLLVFTGGVGENPPSEATVAAQRARAAGVPEGAIRVEERSTSTWENARFASEQTAAARVIVVSDAWHTHRVQRVFSHHFTEVATVGVDSPPLDRAYGAHREVLAVAYYAVRGRL